MPLNGQGIKFAESSVSARIKKGKLIKNRTFYRGLKKRNRKESHFMRGGLTPLSENRVFNMNVGMRQVKGTLAIEGFYLRAKEEEIIKAKILGMISEEEFLRKVLELSYE